MEFLRLPEDLHWEVLSHTDYPTLKRLCMTNKAIKTMCNTDRGSKILQDAKNRYEEYNIVPYTNKKPQIGTLISELDEGDREMLMGYMYRYFYSEVPQETPDNATYVVTGYKLDPHHNIIVSPIRYIKNGKVYINSDVPAVLLSSQKQFGITHWYFPNGNRAVFI